MMPLWILVTLGMSCIGSLALVAAVLLFVTKNTKVAAIVGIIGLLLGLISTATFALFLFYAPM